MMLAGGQLNPSDIQIWWRETIVGRLREPDCAQLRARHLGLRSDFRPMIWAEDEQFLFGGTARLPRPSKADLLATEISDSVRRAEENLRHYKFCWIRGPGGSGKTTLAAQIAARWLNEGRPVYYCRLRSGQTSANYDGLIDVMTALSGPNTLFILDDVHLDEETAATALESWPDGQILLVGREVSSGGLLGQERDPLAKFVSKALTPRMDPRLFGRAFDFYANSVTPPLRGAPHQEVLRRWFSIFSQNLPVFIFALQSNRSVVEDEIRGGASRLKPSHAIGYVRQFFYDPLSEGERRSLRRLAVAAEFEFGLRLPALDHVEPIVSIGQGLVRWVDETRRYELVHANLGRLILAATGHLTADEEDAIYTAAPALALATASKLHRNGITERRNSSRAAQIILLAVRSLSADEPIAPHRLLALGQRLIQDGALEISDLKDALRQSLTVIVGLTMRRFFSVTSETYRRFGQIDHNLQSAFVEALVTDWHLTEIAQAAASVSLDKVATTLEALAPSGKACRRIEQQIIDFQPALAHLTRQAVECSQVALFALGRCPRLGLKLFERVELRAFLEVWAPRAQAGRLDSMARGIRTAMTAFGRPEFAAATVDQIAKGILARAPTASKLDDMSELIYELRDAPVIAGDVARIALDSTQIERDVRRISLSSISYVVLQMWQYAPDFESLSRLANLLHQRFANLRSMRPHATPKYLRIAGVLSILRCDTIDVTSAMELGAMERHLAATLTPDPDGSTPGQLDDTMFLLLNGFRAWSRDHAHRRLSAETWSRIGTALATPETGGTSRRQREVEALRVWGREASKV